MHSHANRGASGGDLVSDLHACRVGAFPCLEGHIEVAGRIGDLAEECKVGRTQGAASIRLHQELKCRFPVPARCRVARALTGGAVTRVVTAVTLVLTHLV